MSDDSKTYRFHVHRTLRAWRLVLRHDGDFLAETSADQWTFMRSRKAADTNQDVRNAVDQAGYCLFKLGATFSELDAEMTPAAST